MKSTRISYNLYDRSAAESASNPPETRNFDIFEVERYEVR